MTTSLPLVSVVTPVYNGEKYLTECVESVLSQTYSNWEYIIVNNCSTDGTEAIAERYALMDKRISVYNYKEFVGVIENHNRALRLVSVHSKYCKIVSADDWLFPECVARMVELAEANPSVGIVGSYQLSGAGTEWRVKWVGLPYQSEVVPGREICRLSLLGGRYVFGDPTSTLYRSDLVRGTDSFYPNLNPNADVSAYYEYLQKTDFGFVHQVLSYERIHEMALMPGRIRINTWQSDLLREFLRYGPVYLTNSEFENRLKELLDGFYYLLAAGFFNFRDKEFWNYQKKVCEELGYPFYGIRLSKAVCLKLLDLIFNPKLTIEKILSRLKNNINTRN
jgi:glycosyltransferase involved in cell wall biosynthesis